MKRQIFGIVLIVAVLGLLVFFADTSGGKILVQSGNYEQKPIQIEPNEYLCSESQMLITDLYNSAQAIKPNGDTYFFNDIGNVFIWLMRQKNQSEIKIFVYSQDTQRYIAADKAWYSRVEMTPMGYGFGAYEYRSYGLSDYYYDEILLFSARGETLINPLINTLLRENKIR